MSFPEILLSFSIGCLPCLVLSVWLFLEFQLVCICLFLCCSFCFSHYRLLFFNFFMLSYCVFCVWLPSGTFQTNPLGQLAKSEKSKFSGGFMEKRESIDLSLYWWVASPALSVCLTNHRVNMIHVLASLVCKQPAEDVNHIRAVTESAWTWILFANVSDFYCAVKSLNMMLHGC